MKPVHQTLFGNKVGNCFAACIASLLELPLGDVPNFCSDPSDRWFDKCQAWLAERGLFMVDVIVPPGEERVPLYAMPDGVPCLLGGPSPRGDFFHAVVGRYRAETGEFLVAHDPHPDNTGLSGKPTSVGFLVALQPHAFSHSTS